MGEINTLFDQGCGDSAVKAPRIPPPSKTRAVSSMCLRVFVFTLRLYGAKRRHAKGWGRIYGENYLFFVPVNTT